MFKAFHFFIGINTYPNLISMYLVFLVLLLKLRLNQGETHGVNIERGVRQGCCMSPILFNLYGEYLMKKAVTEVGDFKIGGRIIKKVRFAEDMAIS